MAEKTAKKQATERGTYCEAIVPDRTYFRAHSCEKRVGLKKHRGLWLCPWHRKAKLWK